MGSEKREGPSLGPLTSRQQELLKIIQGFEPDANHRLVIVCRGSEPWEIQEVIEHRKSDDSKPAPKS